RKRAPAEMGSRKWGQTPFKLIGVRPHFETVLERSTSNRLSGTTSVTHSGSLLMNRSILTAAAAAIAFSFSWASPGAMAHETSLGDAPPAEPYKAVSSLVKLPDFIPGMGQLFVDANTLPAGPFLAYDHDGKLVSTTYMIPLSMMT